MWQEEPRYISQYRDNATGWTTGVRFPAKTMMVFFVLHSVQTVSGAHPVSYPTGIGGKEAEA
jgi:hypothetical protein